jgi:subtilisin
VTQRDWASAFAIGPLGRINGLPLPSPVREWAIGGSRGAGVRVAVIDSGVNGEHPAVGGLAGAVIVEAEPNSAPGFQIMPDTEGDPVGHGTACAGIIRAIAPDVQLYSVRVLGPDLKGRGAIFHAGIRWAVEAGMDVLNLSLSSRSEAWFAQLHDIADAAYFGGSILVCAANNVPGPTYPSQYASVVSVAARPGTDPLAIAYNPSPPVEFGARGIDVAVAWGAADTIVATGNSFAAPHITGIVALMRAKHPTLTPFQVKAVLHSMCDNAVEPGGRDRAVDA